MYAPLCVSPKLSDSALSAFHDEYAKMERALRQYDYHVGTALDEDQLSEESCAFLQRIYFEPRPGDPLALSQRPVREALTKAVEMTLLRFATIDASATSGPGRLRMLSTCPSIGYAKYSGGTLRLGRVRRHFERCMTSRRLEGFGLIDLAMVHSPTESEPSEVGIHYHGACCPVGRTELARHAEPPANEFSSSKNKHGLPVVHVSTWSGPLTTAAVAGLGYYISKISCGLKQQSRMATHTSQRHWGHVQALRALETCSHFAPSRALHAVGPLGLELKAECERRFMQFLKVERLDGASIDHRELRRGWRRVYADLGVGDELRPLRYAA